jgi:hypothetical protein
MFHPATSTAVSLAVLALLSGSRAAAQQLHVYVDSATTSPFQGLKPTLAFATIPEAINQATAQFAQLAPGQFVTIHVAPGTYAAALQLPAHGIRIEPYGNGAMPTITAPVVVATGGNPALGSTTLERLHFLASSTFGGNHQLSITPAAGSASVRVTGCRFTVDTPLQACIDIQSAGAIQVAHVVERSTFVSNLDTEYIVAIQEFSVAGDDAPYASCLYRANDITNFETSLFVVGSDGFESRMRPRILSNAMRSGERIVEIRSASPRCVNNTVALFKDFGNAAQDLAGLWGISFAGCTDYVVANNIVWFEPTVGIDRGDLAGDLATAAVAPSVVTHNYLSDTLGNTNPLLGGTGPQLAATSGLDTQGNVAWCLPPLSMPWAGGSVAVDVAVDFQGDMRLRVAGTSPYVAIGCDQLAAPRAAVLPGTGVDAFGNLLFGQGTGPATGSVLPTAPFTIRTTGLPAGGAMLMAMSLLPDGFVLPGTTTPIDSVLQHLFSAPFGSVTTLPVAPLLFSTAAASPIAANGTADLVFALPANALTGSPFLPQAGQRLGVKLYLQGFVLGPGGTTAVATNRVELGLGLDPTQW